MARKHRPVTQNQFFQQDVLLPVKESVELRSKQTAYADSERFMNTYEHDKTEYYIKEYYLEERDMFRMNSKQRAEIRLLDQKKPKQL